MRPFQASIDARFDSLDAAHDAVAGAGARLASLVHVDLSGAFWGTDREIISCAPTPVRYQYLMRRKLGTNLFGSTFFVLTGFHGAHVFVGVIYMITLATLAAAGKLGPEKSLNVEIGGLYWHFVDVVWIVIFPLVYLIP